MVPLDWIEPAVLPRAFHRAGLQLWWRGPNEPPAPPKSVGICGLLSPSERQRAARFRFQRDRQAFEGRHVFLRRILGELSQSDPAGLIFGESEFGKPSLAARGSATGDSGSNSRAFNPAFNMSCSGPAALLATTLNLAVGVDLEELRPRQKIESVARRVQTSGEQEQWALIPESERIEAFFRLWTRKEALMKLTGEGFQRDPASFAVGFEVRQPGDVQSCHLEGFGSAMLMDLNLPEPYRGAVALPGT